MRVIHDVRRNYVDGNYYMTTMYGSEVGHFCLLMKKNCEEEGFMFNENWRAKILLNDKNDTHTHTNA